MSLALVAAPGPVSLKTSEAEACGITESLYEAFVGLSESEAFIIAWSGVLLGKGRKEGSLANPKNRSQRTIIFEKERASNGNKNFLQMWSLEESRESKPIFSRSKSANCDGRHRLLSLTFGYKQHFQI